jgi:hypothetical protein
MALDVLHLLGPAVVVHAEGLGAAMRSLDMCNLLVAN